MRAARGCPASAHRVVVVVVVLLKTEGGVAAAGESGDLGACS